MFSAVIEVMSRNKKGFPTQPLGSPYKSFIGQ
nr:MAG TPA: hypothetical protein [Caudoviricetes sp.]